MPVTDSTASTFSWGGTLIGEVLSVTPPSVSRARIDQPKLGGTVKSKRKSSKYDVGPLTVTVYCPDAYALIADCIAGTEKAYIVAQEDGSYSGTGWISECTPGEDAEDGDATIAVSIETIGALTFTEAE